MASPPRAPALLTWLREGYAAQLDSKLTYSEALLQLAAYCRQDGNTRDDIAGQVELFAADLATETQTTPVPLDNLQALLGMLGVIALNDAARIRMVEAGVLATTLRLLKESLRWEHSASSVQVVCLAVELAITLHQTKISSYSDVDETIVSALCGILEWQSEEDHGSLRVLEVVQLWFRVRHSLVSNSTRLATALVKAMAITQSHHAEFNQTLCHILLKICKQPVLLQHMVSCGLIRGLSNLLQYRGSQTRELDSATIQLFEMAVQAGQVYEELIHEGVISLLFDIIKRDIDSSEICETACRILAAIGGFAKRCRLDISPFLTSQHCQATTLVIAAENHSAIASLTLSVLAIFVNLAWNAIRVQQLINSKCVEGLLSWYITANSPDLRTDFGEGIVEVVSCCSRAVIDAFAMETEMTTLPALFLCLRSYSDNAKFVSNVFAIVTKQWRAKACSVHSMMGYVEIGVDRLRQALATNPMWMSETTEVVNFLREILLSDSGGSVVLHCDGEELLLLLRAKINSHATKTATGSHQKQQLENLDAEDWSQDRSKTDKSAALVLQTRLAGVLVDLLEEAVSAAAASVSTNATPSVLRRASKSSMASLSRPGDIDYEEYVDILMRLEVVEFEARLRADLSDRTVLLASETALSSSSTAQMVESRNREDSAPSNNAEEAEESPDEARSNASDMEEGAEDVNDDGSNDSDAADEVRVCDDDGAGLSAERDRGGLYELLDGDDESVGSHLMSNGVMIGTVEAFGIDPSQLTDEMWYYAGPNDVQFPRHPTKSRNASNSVNDDMLDGITAEDLVWTAPEYDEPCQFREPEEALKYIEEAKTRRALFDASDIASRAVTVYKCTPLRTSTQHRAPTLPSPVYANGGGLNCTGSDESSGPYEVSDRAVAFEDAWDDALTFDSMFASGNLARANRVGESEYDLVLRHDLGTSGHMQWFYFAVSNIRAMSADSTTRRYRFNIVNLCKPNSLFNHGLQPVVYSVKDAHEKSIGWRRAGSETHYFANQYPHGNTTYYTLTFTLAFWNCDDTFLIAHSYPYTLQTHRLHLASVCRRLSTSILKRSVLCKTLGGANCDLLTISDFSASSEEQNARRAVVLTSRVHPGEPQASWMMRGVVDYLVGDSDVARALRRMFVFHLVPMLNPDGVYYGNNRCSLSGCDLNRQWLMPCPTAHPTIYHAKNLIHQEQAARGVVFFCDLHGHSRKQNVFMYGCDTKKRPNPRARTFPAQFGAHPTARRYVSFSDCSFKVSRDKETTARVVLANLLKIPWCFTLEASFCGANFGEHQDLHFNVNHLQQVGEGLCETLFASCILEGSDRDRVCAMVDDHSTSIPQHIEPFLRSTALGSTTTAGDKTKTQSSSSSGPVKRKKSRRSSSGRATSSTAATSTSCTIPTYQPPTATATTSSCQPKQRSFRKSSPITPEFISLSTPPTTVGGAASPRGRKLSSKKFKLKKATSDRPRRASDGNRQPPSTQANCSATRSTDDASMAPAMQSLWPSIARAALDTASASDHEPNGSSGTPLPELGVFRSQMSRTSSGHDSGSVQLMSEKSATMRPPKPPAPRLRFR